MAKERQNQSPVKHLPLQLIYFLRNRTSQRNLSLLQRLLIGFMTLILLYGILFHVIMYFEGRDYSLITGVYWTLTTMSTLGLGEITFTSDLGKTFTIVVLISGMMFFLVMLPFLFIQFFQSEARVPRDLPKDTKGHVVLTQFDPISNALIKKLTRYNYKYVLIIPDLEKALNLYDTGYKVVLGYLDNTETYKNVRVNNAAMVATTASETVNSNIAFTVREVSEKVPIIATGVSSIAVDVLKLAGCSQVFQLHRILGQSLARRTKGGDALTHLIGKFNDLLIAEANAACTPLVGKTLKESQLQELAGVTVVGAMERGEFKTAKANLLINDKTILVLAGTKKQLRKYNEHFCIYRDANTPVIILGGGRVGRATARALESRGVDYIIVEKYFDNIDDSKKYLLGDAADQEILKKAGIMEAPTVIITTHDDNTNIFLTLACRNLRPDIQIISRSTVDRNVQTLHKAGSDFVLSYASLGSNSIFNLLKRSDILTVAEGLDVFKVTCPDMLKEKSISETSIRSETGCNIIAIQTNGSININPDPKKQIPVNSELILIGTVESESRFLEMYGN